MGTKRKVKEVTEVHKEKTAKKSRYGERNHAKSDLIFTPRADWHEAELPPLDLKDVTSLPPQRSIDELHKYAQSLLEADNAAYEASNKSASTSHKFMSTIMSSGTLEDKVSALTLLVQESPVHAVKAFENLLGLSKKKSRNLALMALAAMKDMLGQGILLPARKLRSFAKQPVLLGVLQGKAANWSNGMSLPGGLQKVHLLVWGYEDWLKRTYFEMIQILENWCGDEVDYARSRAITYVYELLKDKPEQEENLLRLLVNKLGDTDRKIASRASYLLLQLETTHPAMKMIVTNGIESDCLFRPGQSLHAKYYAVITLNQTILSQGEEEVANRLLEIYFSLFIQLLKPLDKAAGVRKPSAPSKVQGGGGKAGKLAAKKRLAEEKSDEAMVQLSDKMIAQVLTGVNRAFPFADTSNPTFEKSLDTVFRVTHSANFNTAVQALLLIQQISSSKHFGAERFYRTLYESLLDPRLSTSSKQIMYLNLLYKSLKADLNAKRVQAFVKRLLQILTMHEPPFICGVLYLVSELEMTFPSIRSMINEPEVDDEDEEEHFFDVPEEGDGKTPNATTQSSVKQIRYDPRKRDPDHAHADRSCLWDLLPFLQHFHPSVSLFAESILAHREMPPKPDPTHYTLMHFLDRFVYRSARSKSNAALHGSSIMQPMAGSNAADLLVKPGRERKSHEQINSEAFWQRKIEDVAADEVFFHSYFNQAGGKKRKGADKLAAQPTDNESAGPGDDEGEDEIWKAIAASKPEVEGADEDDDLSIGDLESAYSASDDEDEAGVEVGGEQNGDDGIDDDEDMPELDSEDDAMLEDDDDLPEDFEIPGEQEEEEEDMSENKRRRKEKKKIKQLPTFASAEDYAKLIGNDDEDL